jgi:hypothetical protein
MWTNILAYVVAATGLLLLAVAVWSYFILARQEKVHRVPLRYYAILVGMIAGGIGMLGLAQALRLLLLIFAKG